MRIGIVVDSACDLPLEYLEQHNIVILPITVRIGEAVLADHRDEQATLSFLHAHVAERGHEAETTPFTVNQIRDLFLGRLVIDYDHVFCMTITKTRSPIHENAMQASFAILNDYKPVRQAAGHNSPFALRVIDTQNLFAAQGITAVEAVRMRDAGASVQQIRVRLEELAQNTHGYMIPRDLYYLRNRARTKGDRSVGLLSAALGSALDIKPVLYGHAGEDQGLRERGGTDVQVHRQPGDGRPDDADGVPELRRRAVGTARPARLPAPARHLREQQGRSVRERHEPDRHGQRGQGRGGRRLRRTAGAVQTGITAG
jgi:DegV family protein with EDD domain